MAETRQCIVSSCRSGEQFEQEKPLTDIRIARCFDVSIDQLVFFYLRQPERKHGFRKIVGRICNVEFVFPDTVMFKICLKERTSTPDPLFPSHFPVDECRERGPGESKLVPEPSTPHDRCDLPSIRLTEDLRQPNKALVLPTREELGQRIDP